MVVPGALDPAAEPTSVPLPHPAAKPMAAAPPSLPSPGTSPAAPPASAAALSVRPPDGGSPRQGCDQAGRESARLDGDRLC